MASSVNFDFGENAQNQLLLNPRISSSEKNILYELQAEFEKVYGPNKYFLVPSSGSSKKLNESVKLIALHRDAVLNSARRFNKYFNATEQQHWGLLLPRFHVAGLGTCARAYLAGSQVIEHDLEYPNIKFLSLVPTQIYDFVVQKKSAPQNLEKVFVGAGSLHLEINEQAIQLGWPLVETYGMTETASMVAVKKDEVLTAMPNVSVDTDHGVLKIKCDSLLTCYIQKRGTEVRIEQPVKMGWYQTEDRGEVNKDIINLLGRSTDYIKILGEGVSLAELNDQLVSVALKYKVPVGQQTLVAISDTRSGHKIILAVEKSVDSEIISGLMEEFNQIVRPYEKISSVVIVDQIPKSDLGKVKSFELTNLVLQKV